MREPAAGVQSAYSYGIDTEDNWGCDVSRQFGVPIHQYRLLHTTSPGVRAAGRSSFTTNASGRRSGNEVDGHAFDTIASQIARERRRAKKVLVKIDIEGAEWDSLMATPDAVLDTFLQMPMELHGIDEAKFVEIVRRLKRKFYLVNLHFNNYRVRRRRSRRFPAWAFQVLWVNKQVGVLDPDAAVTCADEPAQRSRQFWAPDCQLPAVAVSR